VLNKRWFFCIKFLLFHSSPPKMKSGGEGNWYKESILSQYLSLHSLCKVEASISVKISNCSYLETSSYLHVFLLCWEHDPCSLYLGAMIMGMDIFIGCGYGSHTGIDAATLREIGMMPKKADESCKPKHSLRLVLQYMPLVSFISHTLMM
jgi:hypothetical protein